MQPNLKEVRIIEKNIKTRHRVNKGRENDRKELYIHMMRKTLYFGAYTSVSKSLMLPLVTLPLLGLEG